MMRAEIICVGTELLLGQITNTNAKFIGHQLAEIGVDIYFCTTVGDNAKRIQSAIKVAENRADILIFTGGLGPTADDLTKEAIAKYLNLKLVEHRQSREKVIRFFEKRNIEMPESNLKQALIFEGSTPFFNDNGLAVGCGIQCANKYFLVFPGPPVELEHMFETKGIPYLINQMEESQPIFSKVLRFFGYGESKIENDIRHIILAQTDVTIAPLLSQGEVTLRLTTKAKNREEAEGKFQPIKEQILAVLDRFYTGEGNISLVERLVRFLSEKGYTIGSAESFTGGEFLAKLTEISGASKVVRAGFVTYTNQMKHNLLDVSNETLEKFGAVSEICASEMATGVASRLNVDIAVSFTGVAGPDKSEGKDVGTVFIGYSIMGVSYVQSLHLSGNRKMIRERAICHACNFILQKLENKI